MFIFPILTPSRWILTRTHKCMTQFPHHHLPDTDFSPFSIGSNWQQLLKQRLTTQSRSDLLCVCVQYNNHESLPVKTKLMPFNVMDNIHILGNNFSKPYFNIIPEHLYLLCCHLWNFVHNFLVVCQTFIFSPWYCLSFTSSHHQQNAGPCYAKCYTLHNCFSNISKSH
jgi:hypothetical protein